MAAASWAGKEHVVAQGTLRKLMAATSDGRFRKGWDHAASTRAVPPSRLVRHRSLLVEGWISVTQ